MRKWFAMKSPASSFPAERVARPWYREPWPWLLMAGPFVVVIASLASAWIAVRSNDGVIAEDYYRQGLRINQRLSPAASDQRRALGATLSAAPDGELRVRMQGLTDAPQRLRLTLAQPAGGNQGEVVSLERGPNGDYVGVLPKQTPGRWIVTLESGDWRLPTTTVVGGFSELRIGAAQRESSRLNRVD
jgi:hypothetical protein